MSLLTNWPISTPLVIFLWLSLTINPSQLAHALAGTPPHGCYGDYCWTTCYTDSGSSWCYSKTSVSRQQIGKLIYCKGNEGVCQADWFCEGTCKNVTGPEGLWDIIKYQDVTRGVWGPWELCPDGWLVTKVVLKVLPEQGEGDDSYVNAVQFYCKDPLNDDSVPISSTQGIYGDWGNITACPPGHYANGFELAWIPNPGDDKSGVTDFRATCDDGTMLNSTNGATKGEWMKPRMCPNDTYLCGIRTNVQPDQNDADDSGLNSMAARCCPMGSLTAATAKTTTKSDDSTKVTRKYRRRPQNSALALALPKLWLVISTNLIGLSIN